MRDFSAYAAGGWRTIAKPSTVADNSGLNCDALSCPSIISGPMGYQAHCESYIASTANWDLARRLVARWGETDGWKRMERLWYLSVPSTRSAYQVVSGGLCNPSAVVNGCGASNWYRVYLAVDDDDGNLANGTPNACRIWDAFNIHGIACGSRPPCTSGGPSLTGPLASGEYIYDDEDVTLRNVTVAGPGPLIVRVYGGSLTVDEISTEGPAGSPGVSGEAGHFLPTSGTGGGGGRDIVLETWPSRYGNTPGPWWIHIKSTGVSAAGGAGGHGGSGGDAAGDECSWQDAQNGATGGTGGNGGNITIRASGDIDIDGPVNTSGGSGGNGGTGGTASWLGTSPGLAREGRNGGSGGNIVIEQTISAPAGSKINISASGSVEAMGGNGGDGGTGGSYGDGSSVPKPGGNGGAGGNGGSVHITGRELSQQGTISIATEGARVGSEEMVVKEAPPAARIAAVPASRSAAPKAPWPVSAVTAATAGRSICR